MVGRNRGLMSKLATRTKWALSAGVVALLATSLSGCFLLPEKANTSKDDGKDTSDKAFAEYFDQKVKWTDCDDLECATIKVPIDWTDEKSESVEIGMAKQAASGKSKGTLFVNPGGPGGSGVDFVQYATSDDLADNFDVVGWDPRGVGASTQVTCLDDADMDAKLYDTFADPYFTQAWVDDLAAENKKFTEACVDNTGDLLAHLDTVSTANDLELMRALLTGDDPIEYLGYSYGTFIGATYAELFPKHVGHMVLDGAVDPMINAFDQLVVQMGGFESAFRAYMTDCLTKADCPFTGTLDEGLAQAKAFLESVDGLGLSSPDGRPFDSATAGTGLAFAMYSEDYWDYLSQAVTEVRAGTTDTMFLLADSYNERGQDGSYGNSVDVYTATECVDADFTEDGNSTLEGLKKIDAAAPTIGRYIALDDYAELDTTCDNWPYPPADRPKSYDAKGAAPILVVGTSNDPATPFAWAKSLASQLDSGVLISVQGEGHTAYNGGNTCVDTTVDDYFIDDTVPSEDPKC